MPHKFNFIIIYKPIETVWMVSYLMSKVQYALEKIESGSTDEGIAILQKLKKEANDETTLFQTAQAFFNYGFLDDALEIAEKLLERYPGDEELILFTAECWIDLGNDLKALELLHSIDETSEHHLSKLLLLADLYQTQGLEEVAESKLLEAQELNPTEPIIWYALAQFYLSQANYYKASLFFEKIMKDDNPFSTDPIVQLNFAETLSMLGHFEKALPYFQKGLQSDQDLDGLFRYGLTAYKANDFEKTIDAFTKLQKLDPQYSTLYPMLANAYVETNNIDKAIEILKEGLRHDEQNDELYFLLSQLHLKKGEKELTEQLLQKSFALNSPTIEEIQFYINFLKEEQRYEDIAEFILELKDRHDDQDPLLDWELAEAYENLEEFEKAGQYFAASYPYLKENSEFLERYGYFLMEEGETEKAIRCFSKAHAIDENLHHLEELITELENRLI